MKKIRLKVEKSERLDSFLQKFLPQKMQNVNSLQVSNSKIRRLIISGSVLVDGKICKRPSFILYEDSSVICNIDEEKFFFEKKPNDIEYELTLKDVLYEDDVLIIVNKPAFVPTEKTIVEDRINMHQCVVEYLWRKEPALRNAPYVGIMHRLDRETSGTLLFTKSRTVNSCIHNAFEGHSIKKTYRAVCSKNSECKFYKGSSFYVEGNMNRISPKSSACKMGLVKNGGLFSKTNFTIVDEENSLCYVDCFLETGRTHQIRVHLSSVGLPLLGDTLYGGKEAERIMLHAQSLELLHPLTKEKIDVKAPLPLGFSL